MSTLLLESPDRTVADVLRDLGDVAPERIRVPAGNATEDDVVRLLHATDKRICELIDGVLVEKVIGYRESLLATYIARMIGNFAALHDLGVTLGADGPLRVKPGRIRFPDSSFVPWERIPGETISDEPIPNIVPTLAVEVISESNTPNEMQKKLQDFFKAGVKLVWYIYPDTKSALAFTSATRPPLQLGINDSLDGGKLLPGFSLPLKDVFAQLERRKKS